MSNRNNRANRQQLDRDNSDDSEAIEENLMDAQEEHLIPVDEVEIEEEENAENLEDNMQNDYREIAELDRYERNSADEEDYEEMDGAQRRLAEEELDEQDRINMGGRNRRNQGAFGNLLDGLDDDSSDVNGYNQRLFNQRLNSRFDQIGEEQQDEELENEEEEKFEEEKYVDKEKAKGKLAEWIAEERTIRFIKYRFRSFLKSYKDPQQQDNMPVYIKKVKKMCEQNKNSLEVSYTDIQERENMKILSIWIMYEPTIILPFLNEVVKEIALKSYPDHALITPEFFVCITNIPYIDKLRELRQRNIGHLIQVQGVITKRSAVYSQLQKAVYLCACGQYTQELDGEQADPTKIGKCEHCQRTGPYVLQGNKSIYRNYQKVVIQEVPGQVPAGRVPTQKEVILLSEQIDICRPGDEVQITGIYNFKYDYVLNVKHGFPLFSTIIEANYVRCMADVENIKISDQDLNEIQEVSKQTNVKDIIINSIAPSIHGHKNIKTALALSMFGGIPKVIGEKHRLRGDINVLICGDPGVAKSQFLKSVQKTFNRTVYTTGKGASAVGLTAAVKRDTETKEWVLEGGAMVLADSGICLIDEFDKMNDEDRTSIHEAMEQQTISVSKAGIVASLQARCSVVAASNPKTGRYNSSLNFMENVDLTDPIVSRFDVLCVVKDEIDQHKDGRLATFVINSHTKSHPKYSKLWQTVGNSNLDSIPEQDQSQQMEDEEQQQQMDEFQGLKEELKESLLVSQEELNNKQLQQLDLDILKKYIIHAKTFTPKITEIDKEKIKKFYVDLRQQSQMVGGIAIAVRHIESIIRISEAFAKMSLRNEVKSDDIDRAISVVLSSFIQSQKDVVAKKLEYKFQKYLVRDEDDNGLLFKILRDLMADRRKIQPENQASVSIPISTFIEKASKKMIQDVTPFLQSREFQESYTRRGDTISDRV